MHYLPICVRQPDDPFQLPSSPQPTCLLAAALQRQCGKAGHVVHICRHVGMVAGTWRLVLLLYQLGDAPGRAEQGARRSSSDKAEWLGVDVQRDSQAALTPFCTPLPTTFELCPFYDLSLPPQGLGGTQTGGPAAQALLPPCPPSFLQHPPPGQSVWLHGQSG